MPENDKRMGGRDSRKSRQTTVIKVGDTYGLCNRLFPFAHLLAAAVEYGWSIRHAAFAEFSDFFEGTNTQPVPVYPPLGTFARRAARMLTPVTTVGCRVFRKMKWHSCIAIEDHQTCDLSDHFIRQTVESCRVTQLAGLYFYDTLAFSKHADLVRQYFCPIPFVHDLVSQSLSPARAGSDVVVGVHIRHGDYQTFCNGIMYYTFAEYARLMKTVAELFPGKRVSFLVCSNAALPKGELHGLRVHPGPGHVVGDVYALARCDYIIGPPSTYSEWASFYGQVPRYIHRAKDYEWNGQPWPGLQLQDFSVHSEGFARCNPKHPATLIA